MKNELVQEAGTPPRGIPDLSNFRKRRLQHLVQDHVLCVGVPLILLGRISTLFVFIVTSVCIGILLFFALLGGLDLDNGELVVRQLVDEYKVVVG